MITKLVSAIAVAGFLILSAPLNPVKAFDKELSFIDPLIMFCSDYTFTNDYTYWHKGVDMTHENGCIVNAAEDGIVVHAGWSDYGDGNYIEIDHRNNVHTKYKHAEKLFVKEGDHVLKGDPIMQMGASGNATSLHLHFEILENNNPVNPQDRVQLYHTKDATNKEIDPKDELINYLKNKDSLDKIKNVIQSLQ